MIATSNHMKLMIAGGVYLLVALIVAVGLGLKRVDVVAMQEIGQPAVLERDAQRDVAGSVVHEATADSASDIEVQPLGYVEAGKLIEPAARIIGRTGRRIVF